MKYETVIFDFNGVLSHDHFYTNPGYTRLSQDFPGVYEFIQTQIFRTDRVNQWMRNELTAENVNRYIAENTDVPYDTLSQALVESIKRMIVDDRLLSMAMNLKRYGTLLAIVTDNMDVFSQITIEHHNLNDIFPVIINSADYGILKGDRDGELFDIAHYMLGSRGSYTDSLLIDDSQSARRIFRGKGGHIFPYVRYDEFAKWAYGDEKQKPDSL